MPKKITVIERKLKRERVLGQVFFDDHLIEIEERLKPKAWLAVLVHEATHLAFPDASEAEVLKAERIIAGVLWQAGVRRVFLK